MSDTAFVQETLTGIYTVKRFGSVKAAQFEAWDFLRKRVREKPLKMRRVRTFFEGTAKVVRGEEKDAVRAAEIEEARREQSELRARLARLDAALALADEAFHRETRAALQSSLGELRRMDSSGNEG
jgi:hypothetical protein